MSKKLKIIFAGTPDFAVTCLDKLLISRHEVVCILTQPDRVKGRGQKIIATPVKQRADNHGITVHQPTSLKSKEIQTILKAYDADLMVVVAYGLLIPPSILSMPKGGCMNVHGSLLPKYRGAAPIQYSLLNEDKQTGITIMQMDAGLDTGPMLLQKAIDIEPLDNSKSLYLKMADLGATLLMSVLDSYCENTLEPVEQDNTIASYAGKIDKQDARIDWTLSANLILARIRAYNPWPMAYTEIDGIRVRALQATVQTGNATPGTIVSFSKQGIDVGTGDGILRILECQLAGKKPVLAESLFNSHQKLFYVQNNFV